MILRRGELKCRVTSSLTRAPSGSGTTWPRKTETQINSRWSTSLLSWEKEERSIRNCHRRQQLHLACLRQPNHNSGYTPWTSGVCNTTNCRFDAGCRSWWWSCGQVPEDGRPTERRWTTWTGGARARTWSLEDMPPGHWAIGLKSELKQYGRHIP